MLCSPACLWSLLPAWWPVPGLWFMVGWGSSAMSHVGWGGLGTASGRLRPSSRLGPGAADAEGSWMGLRGAPSRGLVVGAGAGSWSVAAGGAQAISFTSTG